MKLKTIKILLVTIFLAAFAVDYYCFLDCLVKGNTLGAIVFVIFMYAKLGVLV